jgi:hypothetical protein
MLDGEMRFAVGECRRLHEDARAICRVQARADDRIRRAELEARYRGTVASQRDIEQARARARHEVGRARPSLT